MAKETVSYEFRADTRPLTRGVDDAQKSINRLDKDIASTGKGVDNMGDSMESASKKTMLLGTALAAISGAAIIAAGKQLISAFADYEQLVGGVETIFKDSNEALIAYAEGAYKTAGLSANQYMQQVTSFSSSLIQSLGGDTKAAVEYANGAITDMSDNANKFGTDISSIQDAYQGFAKQNFTMLDNLKLGYGGTKTEMERLLKDATKLSGIEYSVGSFADITAAIHVIQTELDVTGTTAKEAADTISGSFASTVASFNNFIVALGRDDADWGAVLGGLGESVGNLTRNLFNYLARFLTNIPVLAKSLLGNIDWDSLFAIKDINWDKAFKGMVDGFLSAYQKLGSIWQGFGELLQNIDWELMLTDLQTSLTGWFESVDWMTHLTSLKDGIVKTASSAFNSMLAGLRNTIQGVSAFFSNIDWTTTFTTMLNALSEGLKLAVTSILDFIAATDWGAVLGVIGDYLMGVWDTLMNFIFETDWLAVLISLWEFMMSVPTALWEWFKETDWGKSFDDLLTWMKELPDKLVAKFKEVDWEQTFKDVLDFFLSLPGKLVDELMSVDWGKALSGIGSFFGDIGGKVAGWFSYGDDSSAGTIGQPEINYYQTFNVAPREFDTSAMRTLQQRAAFTKGGVV